MKLANLSAAAMLPASSATAATTPLHDYPGYFQVTFDAPWSLEIDGIQTAFEFDENNCRDLGAVVGQSFPAMQKAFCRNTFTMPADGKVVFGMGCDWFLACRIDGKEILNVLDRGNGFYPIATSNYVFELDIKAGKHDVELEAISGDLSFLLAFGNVMPCDPSLLNEPFLTDIAPGTITVSFATRSGVPAGVDFRKTGAAEWTRAWHTVGGQKDILNRIHRVKLVGLEADSDYEYRLVTEHPYRGNREDYSVVRAFHSAPAAFKPFHALFIADSQGAYSDRAKRVDQVIAGEAFPRADLLGHLGDYSDSTENIERALFGGLFEKFNGKPSLIVRGNHEYLGKQSSLWFQYFGSAMKLIPYGDVVFLMLDCGNGEWREAPSPQSVNVPEPYWAEQTAWFEAAVNSPVFQKARFRMILAHGMPFGDSDHSDFMAQHLRAMVDPLLGGKTPKVRIDLWVAGHIHIPIRTVPGKNEIYGLFEPKPQPRVGENYSFPIVALSGPLGYVPDALKMTALELAFTEDKLTVTHRDLNGETFDCIEIARGGRVKELKIREDFKKFDVPAPEK